MALQHIVFQYTKFIILLFPNWESQYRIKSTAWN